MTYLPLSQIVSPMRGEGTDGIPPPVSAGRGRIRED
jgi:hypothetical protein